MEGKEVDLYLIGCNWSAWCALSIFLDHQKDRTVNNHYKGRPMRAPSLSLYYPDCTVLSFKGCFRQVVRLCRSLVARVEGCRATFHGLVCYNNYYYVKSTSQPI